MLFAINFFLLYFIGRTANHNSATHIGIESYDAYKKFIVTMQNKEPTIRT